MDGRPAGLAPQSLVGEPTRREQGREYPGVEHLLVTADVEGALTLRDDGVRAARQPGVDAREEPSFSVGEFAGSIECSGPAEFGVPHDSSSIGARGSGDGRPGDVGGERRLRGAVPAGSRHLDDPGIGEFPDGVGDPAPPANAHRPSAVDGCGSGEQCRERHPPAGCVGDRDGDGCGEGSHPDRSTRTAPRCSTNSVPSAAVADASVSGRT